MTNTSRTRALAEDYHQLPLCYPVPECSGDAMLAQPPRMSSSVSISLTVYQRHQTISGINRFTDTFFILPRSIIG